MIPLTPAAADRPWLLSAHGCASKGSYDAETSPLASTHSDRDALAADLPIREVILYKHGVAYFERAGELKPGETAQIDFKADDMNDVLKSLTITDRNGGKIGSVRYDASETAGKAPGGFSVLRRRANLRSRRSSIR